MSGYSEVEMEARRQREERERKQGEEFSKVLREKVAVQTPSFEQIFGSGAAQDDKQGDQ